MSFTRAAGLLALSLLAGAPGARAHTFAFTDVRLALDRDTFAAEVTCDLDALALGVEPSADSAALAAQIEGMAPGDQEALVAQLVELLKRRLRVRFDGEPVPFEVTLPERGLRPPGASVPSALGLVARLQGHIPAGSRTVSIFASRAFPPVRLNVVSAGGRAGAPDVLARGENSRPIPLAGLVTGEGAFTIAGRFLRLGFSHILPEGLDHVLFVLGLSLLSSRLKPLVLQVTAFTLAHTATLALAVYGVVTLPPRLVEPLIAASIVYVAVENLIRTEASWARLAVVFAFGLLHGLGFAGVLSELGWPQGRRLPALVAFNVGVELGQLTVIGLALGLLAVSSRLKAPRRRVEQALSLLIAGVALVWTVQRVS